MAKIIINTWDPERCEKAWSFATLAHQGQSYGGPTADISIDYINHVGSVAMEVMWALSVTPEYDADLAIQCALLHDVIEDTVHTYEEVLQEFGREVADGVLALSKNESLPNKQQQMQDSLDRIRQQPREIWMVKMADRITNLRYPPHYWGTDKMRNYSEEAKLIHHSLRDSNASLADRLLARIQAYGRFFEVG